MLPSTPTISVVIPAGGSGSRMGIDQAKQYLTLNNKMVLEHTLHAFEHHALVSEIILVLPEEDLKHKPISFWHDLGFNKVKYALLAALLVKNQCGMVCSKVAVNVSLFWCMMPLAVCLTVKI